MSERDQKGRSQEERIVEALEAIERHLRKFVEEGITIWEHQNGPEQQN